MYFFSTFSTMDEILSALFFESTFSILKNIFDVNSVIVVESGVYPKVECKTFRVSYYKSR